MTGGTPTVLTAFNGKNGSVPLAGMILVGNTFYGVTQSGGTGDGHGIVFSLPITGGTPTILANLDPFTTGAYFGATPTANLVLVGNTLYGATNSLGANNYGAIFSVPITGGTPTVVASLNGSNGNRLDTVLTASGNTLYGTTAFGGANDNGTVFKVDLSSIVPITSTWNNSSHGIFNLASNWTNNYTPNGVDATANLLDSIVSPTTLFLYSPVTLGTLNFNSLQSYNIVGSAALTLQASSGAANINVQAGSHEVSVPVYLDSDAVISGAGTLVLSGGIYGNHSLTVLGNLSATTIEVDSLTIGVPGVTTVPEPSTLVLLGAFGFALSWWRKRGKRGGRSLWCSRFRWGGGQ
jgi:uncharacterized repeat protein (TIGR03803 family)